MPCFKSVCRANAVFAAVDPIERAGVAHTQANIRVGHTHTQNISYRYTTVFSLLSFYRIIYQRKIHANLFLGKKLFCSSRQNLKRFICTCSTSKMCRINY